MLSAQDINSTLDLVQELPVLYHPTKSKQLMLSNKHLIPTLQKERWEFSVFFPSLFAAAALLLHFRLRRYIASSAVLEYLTRGFRLLPFVSVDVDKINFE